MSRPEAAVRVAMQLIISTDFLEFLRRFIIVIVEDAIMHPLFPLFVWILAASTKGLLLREHHVNACLTAVFQVASVNCKDYTGEKTQCFVDQANFPEPITLFHPMTELSPSQQVFVKSLLVRASLGGWFSNLQSPISNL